MTGEEFDALIERVSSGLPDPTTADPATIHRVVRLRGICTGFLYDSQTKVRAELREEARTPA